MTLSEIIARLEAATGPDNLLDQDIEDAISDWENLGGWRRRHKVTGAVERFNYQPPPAYTASVDVALALVPDGVWLMIKQTGGPIGSNKDGWIIELWDIDGKRGWGTSIAFPVALCIAALRARSAP
jgi:hypothetical protein